ncbi:MAG: DUF4350 domain-containing protein [Acidobacteriota bacterium]
MLGRNLLVATFLLLLGLFSYGVIALLESRFEAGDMYAPYSSLRSDPLGLKAFYESLEQLPGTQVRRNLDPSGRLVQEETGTLIIAGIRGYELRFVSPQEVRQMEQFVGRGGRLAILLYPLPLGRALSSEEASDQQTAGDQKSKTKEESESSRKEQSKSVVSLEQRWGFEIAAARAEARSAETRKDSTKEAPDQPMDRSGSPASSPPARVRLPGQSETRDVGWHSHAFFRKLDPAWRIIGEDEGKPVLIERSLGAGSLVLSGDSYFASNEALWKDRQPALLAWLVGTSRQVFFDETHFGIQESPGVMNLARRYRLHGLLAGVAVLVGLFVWRSTTSFLPPLSEAPGASFRVRAGRDTSAGLSSLLRRTIPSHKVVKVCLEEWKRSAGYDPRPFHRQAVDWDELEAQAAQTLPGKPDPAAVYRKLCTLIGPVRSTTKAERS